MPIPVNLSDLRTDAHMQIQQKLYAVAQSARNLADLTQGQHLESDGAMMFALNSIQIHLSDAFAAARILAFLKYCKEGNHDNAQQ